MDVVQTEMDNSGFGRRWLLATTAMLCLGFSVACKQKQAPKTQAMSPLVNKAPGHRQIAPGLQLGYLLHPVAGRLAPQKDIAAYVAPFRRKLRATMNQVLARTRLSLVRDRPESSLGNLVSDMARSHMRHLKKPVDVFITNLGGIRNDLAAGPITIGAIYECLPFENILVRVKVSGKTLGAIFDLMAKRGGEPFSGARYRISKKRKKALRIKIGKRLLQPKQMYWLGTSDYVAKTGFLKPQLKGFALETTSLLLRDSVMWGLRRKRVLKRLRKDGRVVLVR